MTGRLSEVDTYSAVTGAFFFKKNEEGLQGFMPTSGAGAKTRHNTALDASRASSVYSGTSLQPSAGLTILCIKH